MICLRLLGCWPHALDSRPVGFFCLLLTHSFTLLISSVVFFIFFLLESYTWNDSEQLNSDWTCLCYIKVFEEHFLLFYFHSHFMPLKKILIRYLASWVSYYIKTIWKLERLYYLPVVLGDTVFRPRHSSSGGCVFTTRLSCVSAQGALRGILLLCEHTGDPQHQHLLHGRCFITFVCKPKN